MKKWKIKITAPMLHLFIWLTAFNLFINVNAQPVVPRDTSYTAYQSWIKIKKQYPEATIAKPEKSRFIKEYKDVVYHTVHYIHHTPRPLDMDVYVPDAPGKFPSIIFIHGGGWKSGEKEMQAPLATRMATRGFVTACINYRLSPEAQYPAAVLDIKAAVQFMRANADKYQIDPDMIILAGASAGGHLASLAGMTFGIEKWDNHPQYYSANARLAAIINIDGVLDFTDPAESGKDTDPNKPSVGAQWLGATYAQKPELWQEASPLSYAGAHCPPMLFINSSVPRFHAGRDEVIKILNNHSVPTRAFTFEDAPHTFWLFDPWIDPTIDVMVDFLRTILFK
jgi:acetyl esterase/lipase